MLNKKIILLMVFLAILLTGCSSGTPESNEQEKEVERIIANNELEKMVEEKSEIEPEPEPEPEPLKEVDDSIKAELIVGIMEDNFEGMADIRDRKSVV